jgi:membrane-associated protease RseP (regulator of RpoE activity)
MSAAPTATDAPPRPPPPASGDPAREQRSAFLRLALIVAAAAVASIATGIARTMAVIAAIVVIIMLHELGHFATAKWSGMKVTEYFLGFGPRLWSVRRGETDYGVKAIPAGGYVRIIGMTNLEDVAPQDEARTYRAATFPRRLLVVSAGSLVHFLLAIILLWVLLAVVGTPGSQATTTVSSVTVLPGRSPAQVAGLRPGDRIVALDGRTVQNWNQVPNVISSHAGQPVSITVVRDGRTLVLRAVPRDLVTQPIAGVEVSIPRNSQHYGFLGISPAPVIEHVSPLAAVPQAGSDFGSAVTDVFGALRQIFSRQGLHTYTSQITGHVPATSSGSQPAPRFESVVGIYQLAGDAANSGLRDVLVLLIELNVFIGVFNLMPLLPLDGGHVVTAVYERIRSRRGRPYHADARKWAPVTAVVVLALVVVAVASTWADIFHPPANPFQ